MANQLSRRYAGFRKMQPMGQLDRDETVAIVVTGNVLKVYNARKAAGKTIICGSDIEALKTLQR